MAGVTFNELSNSLNDNFTSNPILGMSSLTFFFLLATAIVILVLVFRWYSAATEEAQRRSYELYRQRKNQASSSSPGQQHDRKWFRLRTRAELKWIPGDQASQAKEKNYFTDHLVDISGDGLCFSTSHVLNPEDEIRLLLDTGEGQSLPLNGRVIRVSEESNQDMNFYKISVKFGYIRNGERDRIVAWILKRQRDNINTEKQEDIKSSAPSPEHENFNISNEDNSAPLPFSQQYSNINTEEQEEPSSSSPLNNIEC